MNDKTASSSSDDPIVLRRQIEALEARVEAASQVEKQLARLASLPERNPDPVIETDLDGQITYLNPVARERFPELEEAGSTHPLLRDLPTIIRSLQEDDQDSHLCELTLGNYIYELRTTYVAESGLVRTYAHDISGPNKILNRFFNTLQFAPPLDHYLSRFTLAIFNHP